MPMTPNHFLSARCLHGMTFGTRKLTASRTGTGIAGLLGLLVAATAEVVRTSVHDDGTLQPPVRTSDTPKHVERVRTPRMLSGPMSFRTLSTREPTELPWASVSKLPRSPA